MSALFGKKCQKITTFGFQENVRKNYFWHLIPLNLRIKIFFKIPDIIDSKLNAKFQKKLMICLSDI